jgi:hypothetical protein
MMEDQQCDLTRNRTHERAFDPRVEGCSSNGRWTALKAHTAATASSPRPARERSRSSRPGAPTTRRLSLDYLDGPERSRQRSSSIYEGLDMNSGTVVRCIGPARQGRAGRACAELQRLPDHRGRPRDVLAKVNRTAEATHRQHRAQWGGAGAGGNPVNRRRSRSRSRSGRSRATPARPRRSTQRSRTHCANADRAVSPLRNYASSRVGTLQGAGCVSTAKISSDAAYHRSHVRVEDRQTCRSATGVYFRTPQHRETVVEAGARGWPQAQGVAYRGRDAQWQSSGGSSSGVSATTPLESRRM